MACWRSKAASKGAARLIFAWAAFLAAYGILAQADHQAQRQDLAAAPPPIAFPDWQERRADEFVTEYDVAFPSSYPSGRQENDLVRVRVFLPTERRGPVPAVLILHYWGAENLILESSQARELCTSGIAGVVMTLPYHLARTPKGLRSGQGAIQPDTAHLVATMIQSVQDVRRTVDFLASRPEFDKTRIGLSGTSLGAIVASLAYSQEPRFGSAVFLLGGVDLAGILWSSSVMVRVRDEFRRAGITESRLREDLQAIEPAQYLRPEPGRESLVVTARYDSVIPPGFGQRLAEALNAQRVTIDSGHYGGALARRKLIRLVSTFFEAKFSGQAFLGPSSLYVPTLRFALSLNPERGLQVGLGVDVWRATAEGDLFATALLTAQGLQGFIGQRAGENLAFGIVVLPKRPTAGVLWSTVF